jgi:uncharacterized protein YuzE
MSKQPKVKWDRHGQTLYVKIQKSPREFATRTYVGEVLIDYDEQTGDLCGIEFVNWPTAPAFGETP